MVFGALAKLMHPTLSTHPITHYQLPITKNEYEEKKSTRFGTR
jgi:hypothetical protein